MTFLWPDLLWLLLCVPALIAAYVYALVRKKRTAVRYTGEIFWLLNERRLQLAEQADLERLLAADAHIMRDIGLIDGTPRYRSGRRP